MLPGLLSRLRRLAPPRLLWKFFWNFGVKSVWAVHRFEARRRRNVLLPAFLMLSITDRCNLACQGCWVAARGRGRDMSPELLAILLRRAKGWGCRFFGILGGEPLLHPGLFDVLGRHPECYFQLFTNGTLLTPEHAARMRELGNVTPLISIEGDERVSDQRRRGGGVLAASLAGLRHCVNTGLITGVASSICKSNLETLACDAFLRRLLDLGVAYVWYYIYRPVGPRPHPELALDAEQVLALRRFLVEARTRHPLIIVDAYWDANGRALCPAVTGISYHIGPGGDLEPCPPIQFASETLAGDNDPARAFTASPLLSEFRRLVAARTRGCVLMEDPDLLASIVARTGARDSSNRGTAAAELAAMRPCPSHHLPGREIPERHWAYRLAKRFWFFGFGAYG